MSSRPGSSRRKRNFRVSGQFLPGFHGIWLTRLYISDPIWPRGPMLRMTSPNLPDWLRRSLTNRCRNRMFWSCDRLCRLDVVIAGISFFGGGTAQAVPPRCIPAEKERPVFRYPLQRKGKATFAFGKRLSPPATPSFRVEKT